MHAFRKDRILLACLGVKPRNFLLTGFYQELVVSMYSPALACRNVGVSASRILQPTPAFFELGQYSIQKEK